MYNRVINYEENKESGIVEPVKRLNNGVGRYVKPRILDPKSCSKFVCDFVHFTAQSKPWIQSKPPLKFDLKNPEHLWWHTLLELNHKLSMGVDFSEWDPGRKPPLGYYANTDTK